jgi:hypothetical protein
MLLQTNLQWCAGTLHASAARDEENKPGSR